MARDALPPAARPPIWLHPWTLVGIGLGLAVFGLVLSSVALGGADWIHPAVLGLALLFAGLGVQRRLSVGLPDLDERLAAAGLTATAALAALLSAMAFGNSWDSGRMVAGVAAGFGLFAAFLVALSTPWRKFFGSLAILFHFGGIVTAVTAIEPPGRPAPWLSQQAWAHIYRPYLGFLYLNNAYHFYSPEPGPPTLMWVYVTYESGDTQWIKLPNRKDEPVPMRYQRLLALTESINVIKQTEQDRWVLLERRRAAGTLYGIPMHPDQRVVQYAEPQDYSKFMTAAYARHLARTTVNPKNPDDKVKRLRIYRVTHNILTPEQFAKGVKPYEKWLYLPYYQGEFGWVNVAAEGEPERLEFKLLNPDDPFLYWLIPIYEYQGDRKVKVRDCLEEHAKSTVLSITDLNGSVPVK